MKEQRRRRIEPYFNITPLVDCVFLLLIFFAVTLSMAKGQAGLDVDLPKASAAIKHTMKMANITLTKTGTLYFNNVKVEWDTLGSAISSELKKEPQTLVVIRADRNVLYDDIVRIMDTTRGAGTRKLALAVFEKR